MNPTLRKWLPWFVTADALLLVALLAWYFWPSAPVPVFDGERALSDVQAQVALGARVPGSAAHTAVRAYITEQLTAAGWTVTTLTAERMGHPIFNLMASRGQPDAPVLLMAHYDSRMSADNDPDPANAALPVPGANDGASGVAVLLELARVLPPETPAQLAFVDAEDQGRLPGWDWILGSRALVEQIPPPQALILLDMIGDAELNIHPERNSDPALTESIWQTAADLGYAEFFPAQPKYRVIDDHVPFLERGVAAVDLIDLDYPYWHTLQDTPDKVSAHSLQVVGDVLLAWLKARP